MSELTPLLPPYFDADACLALEDGAVYFGRAFGAALGTALESNSQSGLIARGEVVFNTSMAGYQEIVTDPSYRGQIVVLTHPQVGNYGVQMEASESSRPWVTALIVRDLAQAPNHWLMGGHLPAFLADAGIPGLQGVDTRALTRRLRTQGTMRAALAAIRTDARVTTQVQAVIALAKNAPPLSEQNLVAQVSDPDGASHPSHRTVPAGAPRAPQRIALVDCGVKHNIARSLSARGAEVAILPWTATLADVLETGAQGVVVSNGPGDPVRMGQAAALTQELLSRGIPFLGICLGHQILGIAGGGTTSRLKFGHHGGNHPVQDLATQRVHITAQNHEFQVDADSIKETSGFVISMRNLNDRSVEGLAHRGLPAFSVQYHPEGCPGPQDNQYVFERFLDMVADPLPGWDALTQSYDSASETAAL